MTTYLHIEKLSQDVFAPFGAVLGEPPDVAPTIVDAVSNVWLGIADLMGIGTAPGKQITYLQICARPARYDVIEKHETSAEIFVPLEGQSVLLVVPADALDSEGKPEMREARAFLMDGTAAVLLRRGTWHAVPYNITERATYLVFVDDGIIERQDLHKTPIDPIEFVFA